MGGLEIPLLIAATATAGYSEYQRGRTAAQQAKQEAAWHAHNARIAEKEQEAEQRASDLEAIQHKKQTDAMLARNLLSLFFTYMDYIAHNSH